MKRIGNIYPLIYSMENLMLADANARKGKKNKYGIRLHDRNRHANLLHLQDMLKSRTYHTSEYSTFKVYEPKEREVCRLPYFPDRITHHAVMNVLEPIFKAVFTADTYSCIKGKGIHAAANYLKDALKDVPGTKYCLKIDIKKFYPNIDHDILKALLRRKFKDKDLLWLLDEIIDSAPGVPIGNYLSQYFANFYLTYFDHWIKEKLGVTRYMRYADDIVIPADNKPYLHWLLAQIRKYLKEELNLEIKDNYQVFLVSARGIDVLGYVFRHTHVRIRKGIKKNFAIAVKDRKVRSIPSYMGWAMHADCKHLMKKLAA